MTRLHAIPSLCVFLYWCLLALTAFRCITQKSAHQRKPYQCVEKPSKKHKGQMQNNSFLYFSVKAKQHVVQLQHLWEHIKTLALKWVQLGSTDNMISYPIYRGRQRKTFLFSASSGTEQWQSTWQKAHLRHKDRWTTKRLILTNTDSHLDWQAKDRSQVHRYTILHNQNTKQWIVHSLGKKNKL